MKIIKKFFNRFTIVALLVILQILFFVGLFYYLEVYFVVAQLAFAILGILILFTFNFKSMHVEAKLTWSLIIVLFPFLGIPCYLLFSRNLPSKKHKKLYKQLLVSNSNKSNAHIKNVIESKYYGQIEYLLKVNNQQAYTSSKTEFFKNGESFLEDLLYELKKAKKFIFMEYFIIEDGTMFRSILTVLQEKIYQGVEVKLMYDDIGTINYLPSNFNKLLIKLGIDCVKFNPFIPIVSAIHNNRDHRKITIIDGKVAYTGGINIGDEYINAEKRFGHWKDTAIKIEGPAVDGFTEMFLKLFILQKGKSFPTSQYYNNYQSYQSNGIIVPIEDGPNPISPEYVAENVYLNIINQAENELLITTPYLICDSKLMNALENAASRGVKVKIFTPHIPDKKIIFQITRSNYSRLISKGVEIFEYSPGFLHSKQILVDSKVGIVGTINFDYRSLVHHFEDGVWMYNTEALIQMKQDFKELEDVSQSMLNFKQNKFIYILCKSLEIFYPLL